MTPPWRARAVKTLDGLMVRAASARRYDLVKRHFYSPIPFDTPASEWDRRSPMAGISFDVAAQAAWLERVARHALGWAPPAQTGMFGVVDAEVLYGAMCELRPETVVELGSGLSSEIIHAARGRVHEIYDPVPNERTTLPVHRVSATQVPIDVLRALRDGDVLFVDTTHTVKTGGDVNRIVLDYLPVLAPGVVVHFHDIFLPFEYPRSWADEGRLWAEQYLLQAFLIGNADWEVLCGARAVIGDFPDRVAAVVPRFERGMRASSFWLRRRR